MKESVYNILRKFFIGTITGIRFFCIQIFVWIPIESFFNLLGYRFYWGPFGLLADALLICILAYSMIFSWFYAFSPFKYGL